VVIRDTYFKKERKRNTCVLEESGKGMIDIGARTLRKNEEVC